MTSRAALAKRIAKLEAMARQKPKIDPALADHCRQELNARLNRIRENDPIAYEEVMAKIKQRVAEMRAASYD